MARPLRGGAAPMPEEGLFTGGLAPDLFQSVPLHGLSKEEAAWAQQGRAEAARIVAANPGMTVDVVDEAGNLHAVPAADILREINEDAQAASEFARCVRGEGE